MLKQAVLYAQLLHCALDDTIIIHRRISFSFTASNSAVIILTKGHILPTSVATKSKAAALLLGLRVRISTGGRISVSGECCVISKCQQ
jgi:hypothetical protein